MTIRNNIEWFLWQEDAIRGIIKHPSNSIHIIKAKRQVGKSVMCESLILWYSISYLPTPAFSLYISPSLKQARKVFKEIVKAIQFSPIFYKSNESLLEIRLRNGSIIQFGSAEQGVAGLVGYTVTGCLIIDESAYIADDIYYALAPITDANKSNIICISTPRFRNGWYYDLYSDGEQGVQNIYSYDWSKYDTSALLSEEKLEYYRLKYPKAKFEQDYLGLFTDIGDGVFNVDGCITNQPKNNYSGAPTVLGVDWSAQLGNDDTSLTFTDMDGHMIDIIYFNNKTEMETIQIIIDNCIKYNCKRIQVETNSIGQIYYNLLRDEISQRGLSITLKGFNTNNNSKQIIVQKFQLALEQHRATVLDDDKLLSQLGDFQSKLTSSGKTTYAAGGNRHDDLVLSTLFAYDLLSSGKYCVI